MSNLIPQKLRGSCTLNLREPQRDAGNTVVEGFGAEAKIISSVILRFKTEPLTEVHLHPGLARIISPHLTKSTAVSGLRES